MFEIDYAINYSYSNLRVACLGLPGIVLKFKIQNFFIIINLLN